MRTSKAINHRLGYVTSLNVSIDNGFTDITTYGGPIMAIRTPSYVTLDMSLVIPENNFKHFDYRNLMFPLSGPHVEEEFQCLYCGRVNHISRTDCLSCGACRSFIMG